MFLSGVISRPTSKTTQKKRYKITLCSWLVKFKGKTFYMFALFFSLCTHIRKHSKILKGFAILYLFLWFLTKSSVKYNVHKFCPELCTQCFFTTILQSSALFCILCQNSNCSTLIICETTSINDCSTSKHFAQFATAKEYARILFLCLFNELFLIL